MRDPFQDFNLYHTLRDNEWPLGRFLAFYLHGIFARLFVPLDLLYLLRYVQHKLHMGLFWQPHAGAELLCQVLMLILDTAEERQRKYQRSWGDPQHRRFRLRDLVQEAISAERLPRSAYVLAERLYEELRLAVHLLRGARWYARRQQALWQSYHQAAAIVLSRVLVIWLRLRKETSPWVAYACLRTALRQVWRLLFGERTALPDVLEEQSVSVWTEAETLEVFAHMAKRGHTRAPRALAGIVAEWQRGNLPVLPREGEVWPEAHVTRFRV
jgi:hypothetical protein